MNPSKCSECSATSETKPARVTFANEGKTEMRVSQFTICLDGKTRCEECRKPALMGRANVTVTS